jgi:hypothetical protein
VITRVEFELSDKVGVPQEAAKDIVVMEGPVHYSVLGSLLTGCQNAFIVVREFNQVYAIGLVVVGVDFSDGQIELLTRLAQDRTMKLSYHRCWQPGTFRREKCPQS